MGFWCHGLADGLYACTHVSVRPNARKFTTKNPGSGIRKCWSEEVPYAKKRTCRQMTTNVRSEVASGMRDSTRG